jgi:YegS/Rv2252/BmrU family lipid kinase
MISLIVNPSAGGGRAERALSAVRVALGGYGLEHHVEPTRSLDHARKLAVAAAQSGELAVAFGGDGLVGAVAGALVGAPVASNGEGGVLGVLPGGRGNDFARMLGIPLTPVAACDVLACGVVAELDLGRAGDASFVSIASCGIDTAVNRIANQSRITGNLVYAVATVRALARWQPANFTISIDGGPPRSFSGYTVAAANTGAYGGGMRLAPDASPRDGLLEIVLISHISRLRFLALLPLVARGRHVRLRNVEVLRATSITIDADRPFTVYADGDPLVELPATLTAQPAALKVMVPG